MVAWLPLGLVPDMEFTKPCDTSAQLSAGFIEAPGLNKQIAAVEKRLRELEAGDGDDDDSTPRTHQKRGVKRARAEEWGQLAGQEAGSRPRSTAPPA